MTFVKTKTGNRKQNGIALLVLVIAIALVISTVYISSISVVDIKVNKQENTHIALKKAKQALIDYAVMHADGMSSGDAGEFGYLPCPHININGLTNEGEQQIPNCGGKDLNSLGFLPWKTLGTGDLRDGSGNCLWYAVSSSYKNSVYSGLINEDTNGMFQVVDETGAIIEGNNPEDRVVAIVFAPGTILDSQDRTFDSTTLCGDDGLNPQEYLEGNAITNNSALVGVSDNLDQFMYASLTSETEATPYNDRLITITRDEIWWPILQRSDLRNKLTNLTEALALCLSDYSSSVAFIRLPWPAPMDLADYREQNNYSDTVTYAGRFPFRVQNSNTAITGAISDELFTQANCINLGAGIDLVTTTSEYRILWDNWKDHFFYVISEDFKPAGSNGSCGSGNCINYKGTFMAGIVIFSGSRAVGQIRTGPVFAGSLSPLIAADGNTKDDISNYIENNVVEFNSNSGTASYIAGNNDIMYCIQPDMSVIECPP